MIVSVSKANDNIHKLFINVIGGPTIKIGAHGYEDYTTTRDEVKKDAYIKRHSVNEDWNDPTTKGFWARWLLWNKKTLALSIKDVNERFPVYAFESY
jgi:hypothetical protein